MAQGSTHDAITLWTVPLITGGVWLLAGAECALVTGGSYLFSGLMFSGDLDLHSNQYKRWGVLRWIWLPYRRCFKHRSWWTHGPIVGTLVRLIYVALWGILGSGIIGLGVYYLDLTLPTINANFLNPVYLIWALVGLELGSLSHSLSDVTSSGWKRIMRRFRT